MTRNIYKLKLYINNPEEGRTFIDIYLDVSTITSFYIPIKDAQDPEDKEAINITSDGDNYTIMQQPHIIQYLTEEFVNKARGSKSL